MKIVCIGGGPAGLYFALLMKQMSPAHEVTVVERNKPYDTFGWGVVFSDATMDNMRDWDPVTAVQIEQAFNHWDDIELLFKGRKIRSGGHGFVGIGRKHLLNILQARCEQLGVNLVFETDVQSDEDYPDADLVIACDGVNSRIRSKYADIFKPDIVTRPNRYIWLGTNKVYEAFTFDFVRTPHGWFQAHIYKFDDKTSTFIVETTEECWKASGLDTADQEQSIAFCEKLFADNLQGEKLMTNARHLRGSAWINFQRVVCDQWWLKNRKGSHVVLMGDAVHTAHFAIGSGTKLAIEDAIELARQFKQRGDAAAHIPEVLAAYQEARRVETLRIQNAAWNAMEWFEVCGQRYCDQLEPEQFMYSMLTRSQRISHENLRMRDAQWLGGYEKWLAERNGVAVDANAPPPMFLPYTLRGLTLKNRIVVSPMAQYSAVDGVPGEFHLVHLGARALGGAGLVFAEMACVSPEGRITPGCPGTYSAEQKQAWKRISDWIHANTDAKFAMQIGHAGAKASTRLAWEGTDLPLEQGNWPIMAASEQQYLQGVSQISRVMTRADMDEVLQQFVHAAQMAADIGVDWLELHCAHGYLLSGFISPLTNQRSDEYGGSLENRLRFPLEVFKAMRAVWPQDKPMSVRISAHDWVPGGITPENAVQIAKAFKAAGADLIDCSSGQVSKLEKPVFGRMYQTPFADRIRQEADIATMAVGAISEADHANSIIAAGRADLCAVARPHLANPAWTLTEAAKIGYTPIVWPKQYFQGKRQMEALFEREKAQQAGAK
ncbi:bifunctional salicylyl-CoA 5-hydroxylase/oxidoreductase [Comamonas testosteroni]|uniref:NADPH dehydrogenase n=1 Tax=Comamonas testosteroni TaxID=285 RepID=A0A8B4RYY8_COMTE|nr:bifunctional salicylyl-CoA 5-hydroxylase/oxidoreductase [Comamonas testosteroni]EHN64656.1 salicylyl-CoA 5-hydroxylase [Comamonas testosteroni ATCC 11996]QQN70664.1 bifunctional salicylyl-CoA 5-hydroxylase/oxidoreductase [Comamonas testosteroni]SUY73302.1 NADPH dehydrogenase [Comamonas testosteroni]